MDTQDACPTKAQGKQLTPGKATFPGYRREPMCSPGGVSTAPPSFFIAG